MSKNGVKTAANAFAALQKAREELLRMGSLHPATTSGKQDILLGHLLGKAKDAIKDEFMKLVDMHSGE